MAQIGELVVWSSEGVMAPSEGRAMGRKTENENKKWEWDV